MTKATDDELTPEEKALEEIVMTRVMRMNATINGIVIGIVFGLAIMIATLWLVIKGGPVVGPNLSLLGQFFIGYTVSIGGSFIGFLYGFITGFILGYFIAAIYNWFAERREKRR
jgi:tetrahydromethanopterin S-methyltransferase subunit G